MSAILAELKEQLKTRAQEKNLALLTERMQAFDKIPTPRVGDWIDFADGTQKRITHDWSDKVQTTWKGDSGRFYLGHGYVSYSGSLEPGIPVCALERTEDLREGWVWFFSEDHWGAGNGVDFKAPFRVYRFLGEVKE